MQSIYLKEEHHQFRESVREFFAAEVDGETWEKQGSIPREIWTKMGELGFLGINFSEKYGGAEADMFYTVVFLEELGRAGYGGFGAAVGVQQYMATAHIDKFGSEELKQRYLVPSITGEKVGALAISEPDVGSDVANLRSKAVRDGDYYVVSGAKTFITNGVDGDFATVAVRTGDEGASGISLLVIDQGSDGLSAQRLDKMGWHSGDTGELTFEEVRVPVANLVGEEGKGFRYIMECFQLERLVAALTSIGGIELTLQITHEYMQSREAFGRPISRYQALRHTFAELACELEASRQLVYHACWLYEQGLPCVETCTMAKMKSSELAKKAADECLQMFGGYGYMSEYPISRIYRDARVGTIVGGTTEIMKEILGKMLIDGVTYAASKSKEASPEKEMSITDIMEQFPKRYKGGAAAAVVGFDFREDDGGTFTVHIEPDKLTVDPLLAEEPDCMITCAGALYRDIELGRTSPEAAFMGGQIQITNLPLMMSFMQSFKKLEPT